MANNSNRFAKVQKVNKTIIINLPGIDTDLANDIFL